MEPKSASTSKRAKLALTASRAASKRATERRHRFDSMLVDMAKVGLSLGDMARNLEAEEITTPRGNWWWSRQQVLQALRHALRGKAPELIAAYLSKVGTAPRVPAPTLPRRGRGRIWEKNLRNRGHVYDHYLPERQRIRSRITKKPVALGQRSPSHSSTGVS